MHRGTDWAEYLRTLAADERDVEGRLVRAGTSVLCNLQWAPGEFREDTPRNRETFVKLGLAWSVAARQRAFFVDPAHYSATLRSQLDQAADARRRFSGALSENLRSLKGGPFPTPYVPPYYHLVPYEWEPTVRQVDEPVHLTVPVCRSLGLEAGLPDDLEWPAHINELLLRLNEARVYRCRRGTRVVDVVVAYVTPLAFSAGIEPALSPAGSQALEAVTKAYDAWLDTSRGTRPEVTVFTIGSKECPQASLTADASSDRWTLISHLAANGQWSTQVAARFGDRLAIRDFLDSLKPETQNARNARIKEHVDQLLPVYPGHITAAKVAAECGLRRSPVAEAFEVLQGQSPETYRLYVTDGQLAIRRAKPGEELSLARAARWRSLIRRHSLGLCGAAVGAAAWRLHGAMPMSTPWGVSLALLCGYTGNQIQRHIQRRIELSKE